MAYHDIEIKDEWDAPRTAYELERLEEHVKEFVSHTYRSMQVKEIDGPFGPTEVKPYHPMSQVFGIIEQCKDGVFRQYGEEQYRHGRQLSLEFKLTEDDDGDTT